MKIEVLKEYCSFACSHGSRLKHLNDSEYLLENMCGAVDLRCCAGSAGPQDGRPAVPLPPTAQDDEEGTAEGLVEEGVEDGVQHGVDVAQPQAGRP